MTQGKWKGCLHVTALSTTLVPPHHRLFVLARASFTARTQRAVWGVMCRHAFHLADQRGCGFRLDTTGHAAASPHHHPKKLLTKRPPPLLLPQTAHRSAHVASTLAAAAAATGAAPHALAVAARRTRRWHVPCERELGGYIRRRRRRRRRAEGGEGCPNDF